MLGGIDLSNDFDIKLYKILPRILPDLSQKTTSTMAKIFPLIIIAYCTYDFINSLQPGKVESAFHVRYVPFENLLKLLDESYELINYIFSLGADIAGMCAGYLMYFRQKIGWRISLYLPLIWLMIQISYGLLSVLQVICNKGPGLGLILLLFMGFRLASISVGVYIILYFLFQIRDYYSEA